MPPKPETAPHGPPPIPKATLDDWFTWHKPTPAQLVKYKAIDDARDSAEATIRVEAGQLEPDADRVNGAVRLLVDAIVEHSPPGADQDAAVRCCRLARNAANELFFRSRGNGTLLQVAISNLYAAKWQANGAIALAGK